MKKTIYNFITVVLCAVFCYSIVKVGTNIYNTYKQKNEQQQMQQLVQENQSAPLVPYNDTEFFLPQYYELYTMNNHLAGWIKIPDTNVDYPVLHYPQYKEYYLRRNFNRDYAYHGSLFIQENCDISTDKRSDNIIIYGHNMTNGTMFGDLEKFIDKDFYNSHKIFYFDTLTREEEYEIVRVFKTVSGSEETFNYSLFVNAYDQEEFDEFISTCKKLSLYDTGVNCSYGDKLITLSTCEYTNEDGRLAIVARRI